MIGRRDAPCGRPFFVRKYMIFVKNNGKWNLQKCIYNIPLYHYVSKDVYFKRSEALFLIFAQNIVKNIKNVIRMQEVAKKVSNV